MMTISSFINDKKTIKGVENKTLIDPRPLILTEKWRISEADDVLKQKTSYKKGTHIPIKNFGQIYMWITPYYDMNNTEHNWKIEQR
jgi:hypothetical protein